MSTNYDYYEDKIQVNSVTYKSFYTNAFSSKYWNIWYNTCFSNEITDLSFLHAISIFLENNTVTENDRRRLLYCFCESYMATDSPNDILNRIIPVLPTSNLQFQRVLRKICNLYDVMPNRTLIGKNDIELLNYVIKSDYNNAMDKCYKIAKSCREALVRPLIVNGKLLFEILTPDNYRCNFDEYGNIIELYVHRVRTIGKYIVDTFDIWTPETYKVMDNYGKSVKGYTTGEPNPYKTIPYTKLNLNVENAYDNNGDAILWELVKAQLDKNRNKILEENSAIYNGFPISAFINFDLDSSEIKLAPGKVLMKDGVNNDINTPPYFEQLNPSAQYSELHTLGSDNMKAVLRDYELPSSMLGDNAEIPSGVALELGMIGLNELRRVDKIKMKQFENEVINQIAKMLVIDGKQSKYSENLDYEISIEYNELKKPTDPKIEFELNKIKFEMGLIDAKTFITVVTDIDGFETNGEVVKYINDNLQLIKGLKKDGRDTNDGSDNNTGTDSNDSPDSNTGTDNDTASIE